MAAPDPDVPGAAPAHVRGFISANLWKTKSAPYKNQHVLFQALETNPPRPGDGDYWWRSHATNFARGGVKCSKGHSWVRDPLSGAWFRKDWTDAPGLTRVGQRPGTQARLPYDPNVTCYTQGASEGPRLCTERVFGIPERATLALGHARADLRVGSLFRNDSDPGFSQAGFISPPGHTGGMPLRRQRLEAGTAGGVCPPDSRRMSRAEGR
uniref:Uncharacterized protein n=1 Tax=Pyrodinium bahamense TaxID=73915 RepID=A0A7S0AMM5_9DINO